MYWVISSSPTAVLAISLRAGLKVIHAPCVEESMSAESLFSSFNRKDFFSCQNYNPDVVPVLCRKKKNCHAGFGDEFYRPDDNQYCKGIPLADIDR